MALSKEGVLSTGSKLSTILTCKPEFVDQLALCLDREMRLILNWKHLARELKVDNDVIKRLEQYRNHSPTIRLFEHLGVTQPQLTIQLLRNAMFDIRRNDLFSLLTKAGCADSDLVQEVIMSQPPSPLACLLDEMALALDSRSMVLANWYTLAIILGVPRKDCWKFERRSTKSPTNQLFQYLEASRPQMRLGKLKEVLDLMKRNDLLEVLRNQSLEDDVLLKDVITPGSELLQTMADKLNRELPAVEDWSHLACKLEIPVDVRQAFGESGQNSKSPTKEVMQWLVTQFPDTTLVDIVKALDRIQRNDAIQIITKQFPDTVGDGWGGDRVLRQANYSSLERLDSSLHDSFSIGLPINDPTGETMSSRYKNEESGYLPKQVAEQGDQSGHCGILPERTDLVGRDDICEKITTTLTSNKVVELVAPPGHGKTSVVVEVAYRMIEKGLRVAYVNPRGVTCVEDLAGIIIEALDAVPGEDTIKELLRRIRTLKLKSLVVIIENIDNLLYIENLENQIRDEKHHEELDSEVHCAKTRGKYKKDDFLTFLEDIGQSSTIHLLLTSRDSIDFVSFPIILIDLPPLNEKDSVTLFRTRDQTLHADDLVKALVPFCGGIPLIICTVLSILKKENPHNLARRLSTSSPRSFIRSLSPANLAHDRRIDQCLQVCFNRLSQENQDVLVMISTFPHRFTREQFLGVFQSSPELDLQMCLDCLKYSSLLRFEKMTSRYSLHPFIRKFFSVKPKHKDAKSVFILYYSDLAVTLCEEFLSNRSKSAIERYRDEKENIREAMTWCGDDHPELDQPTREKCIDAFSKSAVFLAKMMRKQEFESLYCKLARQCRYDINLYSACLTSMGMKVVLSCTCTPYICPRALFRAKKILSHANQFQSTHTAVDDASRAHCLSKLGFCFVREGSCEDGYTLLNDALELRRKQAESSSEDKEKVMLAACFNDLAASQMSERKHMAAIQTRLMSVLPVYESILGDHPFVATTLSWIANSYQALGDYDNAIKFTRRALEIREQLLGQHQETARSLYDLGVAFSAKEDYESALIHLEKAVALQKEVLDTHEELILSHQAMAVALRSLGREEEAEREMELAGECAKRLDSLEVPLDVLETSEEGELVTVSITPQAEQGIFFPYPRKTDVLP